MIRWCPEHGPSLVRTAGATSRIGRHRTVEVVGSAGVDIFTINVLGAGVVGHSILATGVFLLKAVEFEFCKETVSQISETGARAFQASKVPGCDSLDCSLSKRPILDDSRASDELGDGEVMRFGKDMAYSPQSSSELLSYDIPRGCVCFQSLVTRIGKPIR